MVLDIHIYLRVVFESSTISLQYLDSESRCYLTAGSARHEKYKQYGDVSHYAMLMSEDVMVSSVQGGSSCVNAEDKNKETRGQKPLY